MDDFIILASNVIQLKWLRPELEKEFKMDDLKELYICLGVEFERKLEGHTITKNQRSYIEEVLKYFSMEECKPVGFSFDVNSKLLKQSVEKFGKVQREMEGVPYKAGIRSLVYAMVAMRADIAFAVSTVSQFISRTNPPYWMPMKHIMRYLKGHFEPHSGSSIPKIGYISYLL